MKRHDISISLLGYDMNPRIYTVIFFLFIKCTELQCRVCNIEVFVK